MTHPLDAEVLVDGLDHPEGVAWDPRSGLLYAGGELGQIYEVELGTRTWREVARVPGFALGLAVDGQGRVIVCDAVDGAVWCADSGIVTRVFAGTDARPLAMPNYPAFGPAGTLFISDSGGWNEDRGSVWALDAEGRAEVLDDTLRQFPNGLALDPSGESLWVVQSEGPDLHRLDLKGGGPAERVLRLEGTVPDGLAFTSEGALVISCYRPDRLYLFEDDGSLQVLADDPQGTLLAAPTNVCFAGEGLTSLVTANLGRWHLTLVKAGLTGAGLHRPDTWAVDA